MKPFAAIATGFSDCIDSVAASLITFQSWLAPPQVISLIEGDAGEFTVRYHDSSTDGNASQPRIQIVEGEIINPESVEAIPGFANSRIELVLEPNRFLFRALELPGRAAEFMQGVVRAQIDRLTPWAADESAFGWSKPAASRPDHFIITIAASARASVMPYVNAMTARGAHSVAVFASLPPSDHASAPVKVLEESSTSATNLHWLSRVLMMILLSAGIAACVTTAASFMIGADLDEQQRELAHKIASARNVVGSGRDDPVGSIASARRALERRKHEDPIVVLVVDALSQILPDNTYVTELAVDGKKMRVTGVTQDAPNLIGLIERSGRFSHAAFFAPTTRAPANAGEHFHIDADINPLDGSGL